MLEEGEEGLGSEENDPPIIIDAEVKVLSVIPAHSTQLFGFFRRVLETHRPCLSFLLTSVLSTSVLSWLTPSHIPRLLAFFLNPKHWLPAAAVEVGLCFLCSISLILTLESPH